MTHERIAVVTGGSAGIGRAICEQLLAEGCTVISLARRPCELAHPRLVNRLVDLLDREATAQAAAELGENTFPLVTDVTDEASVAAASPSEASVRVTNASDAKSPAS